MHNYMKLKTRPTLKFLCDDLLVGIVEAVIVAAAVVVAAATVDIVELS